MLTPLRFILALIRAILLIVPMAFFLIFYLIFSAVFFKNTPERAFRLRKIYVVYANFILGIKIHVEGQAISETALYVCNHRSFSDPLILSQFLNAYIIAKAEVANIPLISSGAKLTGILYVERENKDSRNAVRKKMTETLRKAYNVLVFPEGTVNPSKNVLPYRSGTFLELAKLNIPAVPLTLEYKDEKDLWINRGLIQHYFQQFGYWRTNVKLVFGKAHINQDGVLLKQEIEDWTNATIMRIHSTWDSYFSKTDLSSSQTLEK